MTEQSMTKSQIWAIYSEVAVPPKVKTEQDSKLHYVSWMDTYAKAMQPNEDTLLEVAWEYIHDDQGNDAWTFPAGNGNVTAEVKIAMNVEGVIHQASLPVWDQNHKSIINPTSSDINNAKMRVRCKALGELGLFWKLWSEDHWDEVKDQSGGNVVHLVPANEEVVEELSHDEKCKNYLEGHLKKLKAAPPITANGLEVKIQKIKNGLRTRNLVDKNFNLRMARWKKVLTPLMEAAHDHR